MLVMGNKRNWLPIDTQTSDAGGTVTMQHSAIKWVSSVNFISLRINIYTFFIRGFPFSYAVNTFFFTSRKVFCFGKKTPKTWATKIKIKATI